MMFTFKQININLKLVFSLFIKHLENFLAVMDWAPRKIVTQNFPYNFQAIQRPSSLQSENPCSKIIS